MKPLPAQKNIDGRIHTEVMPSLPAILPPAPGGTYSKSNRRTSSCAVQRSYPWLLSTSTAVAALFCLLYITKPVIVPASVPMAASATTPSLPKGETPPKNNLMPGRDSLPGESNPPVAVRPTPADPRRALPRSASASAFEETNLRIQHVLTAEAPGGHLDRIDIDVPVLYQSRNLRWSAGEVAAARELMTSLMEHQEKTRQLRAEGTRLLDAWNSLVGNSIPATALRADSPTLPGNQEDAADTPRPAGLTTTDSIEIQATGK